MLLSERAVDHPAAAFEAVFIDSQYMYYWSSEVARMLLSDRTILTALLRLRLLRLECPKTSSILRKVKSWKSNHSAAI